LQDAHTCDLGPGNIYTYIYIYVAYTQKAPQQWQKTVLCGRGHTQWAKGENAWAQNKGQTGTEPLN